VTALRPLGLPQPLAVETDASGAPAWIVWRGQRVAVAAVRDRWRIDDEWWRQPVSRLYYALQLADGQLLVVFADLATGGWQQQRYA
jgi:hypothetical protein